MKNIQHQNISFCLNDRLVNTTILPATTALDLIREQMGLTGAKESCSEGDCGSCTVALGEILNDKLIYKAVTACILPAVKLHGMHVITAEGLLAGDKLHLVQQAIVEKHATQCGYCTPGIVMSLFCLFANNQRPNQSEIYSALEGNLCRCTGYLPINEAAISIAETLGKNPEKFRSLLFPAYVDNIANMVREIGGMQTVAMSGEECEIMESYSVPNSLEELFAAMEKSAGEVKIINGGTDLMVLVNVHKIIPKNIIDISRIYKFNEIFVGNDDIVIGGSVTLSQVASNRLILEKLPVLSDVINKMASVQIRNVASLAGNIANASPVADAACVLLALNAKLILASNTGERTVALENFYKGYKVTDLSSNEIIAKIKIPLQPGVCRFEKSAKRKAVDISTVSSAVTMQVENGIIVNCRLAFGGVAPFPVLAKKFAAFLGGKKLSHDVINSAADIAMREFTPISDVRGSAEYRSLLIRNHVIKSLKNA